MSLRSLAARGVFWTALNNWGYQLATLVVFAVLARLLDPTDFGLVALATVFTSLLKIVADQGMADAIVQRPNLDDEHLDAAFWTSVGFGVILTVLLAAAAWPLAAIFDSPALAPVLAALSFTLAIGGLSSVQRAILTREFDFASLAARSLTSVVIGGTVGIIAALLGAGVWSLVAQTLTFEVVAVITLWIASDWRPRFRFSWSHFRQLLPFGASIVGFRALRLANTQADNLLIGFFLGTTALGFYVVAYRLLRLMINVSTSVIGSVAFPTFARVQRNEERVLRLYYQAIRLAALIAFPAFLGLVVVAPEVTMLVFGPGWEPSIAVMRVLGFAGLVISVNFLNPTGLKALGKPSWRVIIMGMTAVAQVVAILFVVDWGIRAVAIAVTSVVFVMAPVWFYAVHKLIPFRVRTVARQFVSPLAASLLMVAAVVAAKSLLREFRPLWQVVLLAATGVVVYGIALWLIDRRLAREAFELGRLAIPRLRRRGPSPVDTNDPQRGGDVTPPRDPSGSEGPGESTEPG